MPDTDRLAARLDAVERTLAARADDADDAADAADTDVAAGVANADVVADADDADVTADADDADVTADADGADVADGAAGAPPPGGTSIPEAPGREDAAARLDELEERIATLEAELRAVRGYLGDVDAVDEAVERRADAALAAAERALAATEPSAGGSALDRAGDGTAVEGGPVRSDDSRPAPACETAADDREEPADEEAPWPVRRLREAL